MSRLRSYVLPLACALLFCSALIPTLGRIEFSSGSEQLVMGAAVESRRDGTAQRFFLPTLGGEPRLKKPPLATWVAMSTFTVETARELAAGPIDETAFHNLAISTRLTSLLAGLAVLLLTFELGRLAKDRALGLTALAVCGSTFFFASQFIRVTTDVHLALWVTATNVALAHAFLRGRWLLGMTLAGLALGLATLTKGPVGWIQTILPVAVFPFVVRLPHRIRWRSLLLIPAGVLLVALPWVLVVLATNDNALDLWRAEILRDGSASSVERSEPWTYLKAFGLAMPWSAMFFPAVLVSIVELSRRITRGRPRALWAGRLREPGLVYCALLMLAPLLVMVLVRDQKDRYLLPMLPPAAVLTAELTRRALRDFKTDGGARLLVFLHGLLVAVMTIGLPIAAMFLERDEYEPSFGKWLSVGVAVPLVIVAIGFVAVAIWQTRKHRVGGLVIGTAACVMLTANVFLFAYAGAREAQSDLKPIAAAVRIERPNATLHYVGDRQPPPDLFIYAGRIATPIAETLAEVPPPTGDAVVVYRQRSKEPEPTPPAGWKVLTKTRRDESWWWAFASEGGTP